jgi:hypothetical protein
MGPAVLDGCIKMLAAPDGGVDVVISHVLPQVHLGMGLTAYNRAAMS